MTTYTFDKKLFLEQMDKLIDDDAQVVFTNTPYGECSAPTKKKRAKTIGFAFSEDVFEDKEGISDIIRSHIGAIIIGKNIFSKQVQKEIQEFNKKS
jgi:hypothetical protein